MGGAGGSTTCYYLNSDNNLQNEAPRFEVVKNQIETFLPKIYGKYEYKFIDKKTNIIIATAFNIFFINGHNKFRNKYLFWSQEKENDLNIKPIQNFDIIYKKVFIDN